jgi:hypothetical protein
MSLIALDLLEEELYELEFNYVQVNSYVPTRIQNLRYAIEELQLITESDCKTCRYNHSQEELSELNEEEYINAFDKCRTCKNYYPNNFEEK